MTWDDFNRPLISLGQRIEVHLLSIGCYLMLGLSDPMWPINLQYCLVVRPIFKVDHSRNRLRLIHTFGRMQMEKGGATLEEGLGGGGVVTQRGKLCRRCKETFNSSSNTPSSCRFHPSFFVCRRHDDQKRYVAVPLSEPSSSSIDGKYLLLFCSLVLEAASITSILFLMFDMEALLGH